MIPILAIAGILAIYALLNTYGNALQKARARRRYNVVHAWNLFGEDRTELMRLAREEKIDLHSATFRFSYATMSLFLRIPSEYRLVAANRYAEMSAEFAQLFEAMIGEVLTEEPHLHPEAQALLTQYGEHLVQLFDTFGQPRPVERLVLNEHTDARFEAFRDSGLRLQSLAAA